MLKKLTIMEQVLTTPKIELEPGQLVSKFALNELGISPTDIDCFEYYPYLLYKNGNKRYVVQPMPYDQYRVIKIYDFVPAKYA